MSIFYRIIIVLLIIAAGYSLVGIGHFKWMYHRVNNPSADFQVSGNEQASLTLVEFLNYNCGYCKQLHPSVKELLSIRKDIRYIARPISFTVFYDEDGEEQEMDDKVTKMVIAAGLQGKFQEMHDAVLEHPDIELPEGFIEETANLYGLDYDQLVKDSEGKKVQKIIKENLKAFNHTGLYSVPSFMIDDEFYIITDENLPDLKQLLTMVKNAEAL